MANEIQANFNYRVANGNFEDLQNVSISIDQANVGGGNPGVVEVATASEVITVGDISVFGIYYFRNLDTTNNVTIGPESGGEIIPMICLKPGEFSFGRLEPGITLRARSNTATVKLLVQIYED